MTAPEVVYVPRRPRVRTEPTRTSPFTGETFAPMQKLVFPAPERRDGAWVVCGNVVMWVSS